MTATYDLQTTIVDSTIRLSGTDFSNDTLSVDRGVSVLVRAFDAPDHWVYLVELPPGGERGECWARVNLRGLSRRLFDEVIAESKHVLFAIEKTTSKPVFGPIIKIKPKG